MIRKKSDINRIKGQDNIRLVNEVKNKYKLNDRSLIMYTDGSKPQQSVSTGASVILKKEDGYYFSLSRECSVFTAEATTTSSALKIALGKIDFFDNFL